MRILVCGGRDFNDSELLYQVIDRFVENEPEFIIIEGNALGADRLARYYAIHRHAKYYEFPANWKKYGKKAGPIRNQQMIDEGKPDLVIAFPTEKSIGTYDMIRRAKKHGIKVVVYGPSEWT